MKNNKGYTPPEVEKWISDNLDADVNLKARMAAVYLMTTTPEIQERVIDGLYCNHDGEFIKIKLLDQSLKKLCEQKQKKVFRYFFLLVTNFSMQSLTLSEHSRILKERSW